MTRDTANMSISSKINLAKARRKIAKPMMEKKRRARINASLNELKSLLVEVLHAEGCRHSSKMEKADILEMAVRHLRNLQLQQPSTSTPTCSEPATSCRSETAACCAPIPISQYKPVPTESRQLSQSPPQELNTIVLPDSSTTNIITPPPATTKVKIDSNNNSCEIQRGVIPVTRNTGHVTSKLQPQLTPITTATSSPLIARTGNGDITLVLPQQLIGQGALSGLIVPVGAGSCNRVVNSTHSGGQEALTPLLVSINLPAAAASSTAACLLRPASAFHRVTATLDSNSTSVSQQQPGILLQSATLRQHRSPPKTRKNKSFLAEQLSEPTVSKQNQQLQPLTLTPFELRPPPHSVFDGFANKSTTSPVWRPW